MAMPTIINGNKLGTDMSTNGSFGNLTPGGAFSNTPLFFPYNPTKNSAAKITLTLQKVKDSIKKQLVLEDGPGADTNNTLVESFLLEFTSLLVDYRDLRNHVFFGSAYTELAYNIKFLVDNYPYNYLISTLTSTLNTIDSEFTITDDTASETTTIILQQSSIKDGIEEFNFFDNNTEFSWLDYDLLDINNTRYPIIQVIAPYTSDSIFDIDSITTVTETPLGYTSYDTLQLNFVSPTGYALGQGISIFENILTDGGSGRNSLDDNYIVSKIISANSFEIVSKYAGVKVIQGDLDLVTDAVDFPPGFSVLTAGKVRKVPYSQNTRPYGVKITVKGNVTDTQLITYTDVLNNSYSGFMLSLKQVTISEFNYNLTPVQRMLLAPAPINLTPWPRRIVTNNIQHLVNNSIFTPLEGNFVDWLQSPSNSYLSVPNEDTDLAFSDSFSEYRLVRALALDESQTNQLIRRCIPADVISELNDTENAYFQRFILIAGWFFDQIKLYVDFIKYTHTLNYTDFNQLSPQYYKLYADYYGFDLFSDDSIDFSKLVVQTEPGYYFVNQTAADTKNKYFRFTLQQLQFERQKRLLLSLFYLYSTKGTPGTIKKLVSLLGAPDGLLIFNEYSFDIQNTDAFDYYDVATLKGVRIIDNDKTKVPKVNFEIDPDFPVPLGMPPVYRMRFNNESTMNLRMASVQTNPNGAIDFQIENLFGKQKYNYAKFNNGEFASLQSLNPDFTFKNSYQALPLTIPDKFSGITVEYMIPKTGFTKGIANNLDEVSIHICSLFQLPAETVPNAIDRIYTYPLPEVFSNFDFSSTRTTTSDTSFALDDEPNIKSDFNTLNRYFKNVSIDISITNPYIICRLEGNDLVIRIRLTPEDGPSLTGDIGERVAIMKNVFYADGLNHNIRMIFRAEGVELYKDFRHKATNINNKIGIALWQDPSDTGDGIPYCAFEIPKSKIATATYKPFDDNIFVNLPTNDAPDNPKYWDLFIGFPSNVDFYFKKVEVFENYSIDSFDIKDNIINNKNYTAEYHSFDFSLNAGDNTNIAIKCQFSQLEPDIVPADYSYILPVEAFNNKIVVQNLNLTSKTFRQDSTQKYFKGKTQDFFNFTTDIFSENAFEKDIHKQYTYRNFDGKLNYLYSLYSPQVLTYADLADFLDLVENKFKTTIKGFIPIVIDISQFGRLIVNSIFNQPKIHYTNIEKECVGTILGDFAITQLRIYDISTTIEMGQDLTISFINPDTTALIPPISIPWNMTSSLTLFDVLAGIRNISNNPYNKYLLAILNEDLLAIKINAKWYYDTFGMDANGVTMVIDDGTNTFTSVFAYGSLDTESPDCGSIKYSLPAVASTNVYVYYDIEGQPSRVIYYASEDKPDDTFVKYG